MKHYACHPYRVVAIARRSRRHLSTCLSCTIPVSFRDLIEALNLILGLPSYMACVNKLDRKRVDRRSLGVRPSVVACYSWPLSRFLHRSRSRTARFFTGGLAGDARFGWTCAVDTYGDASGAHFSWGCRHDVEIGGFDRRPATCLMDLSAAISEMRAGARAV